MTTNPPGSKPQPLTVGSIIQLTTQPEFGIALGGQAALDAAQAPFRDIERLRARVLELEAQCGAGAASEQRWIDWLVAKGLLHYYPSCTRPDRTHGPAWVLRRPYMVAGDSCEAWHADSAAGALRKFLSA